VSLGVAALAPDAGIAERMARIDALFAAVRTGDASAAAPATAGASSPFASQLASATAAQAGTETPVVAGGDAPYAAEIDAAAARHSIDPALLKGLIQQESGFDPTARSGAGATGLTQLMPGTAASLGVTDPSDPAQAIEGGAKYLADQLQRFGGDPSKALAAYNAGPGAVARFGGVPPYAETQQYVQKVLGYAAQYGMGQAAATSAVAPPALPLPTTVPASALSAPVTT
jgi:soluble lytic murein transglycosylase-like protein